jgi:hypothetical protein
MGQIRLMDGVPARAGMTDLCINFIYATTPSIIAGRRAMTNINAVIANLRYLQMKQSRLGDRLSPTNPFF